MDWRKTLATVAPAIATALGGPLAGVAVQMAGKAIGLGDGATESDVEAAVLSGNPDVLVRLREVNAQFEKDMAALGVDLERIHAGDRSSARDMAKANMMPQIALSFVFIGGYFGAMFALHGVLFQAQEINGYTSVLARDVGPIRSHHCEPVRACLRSLEIHPVCRKCSGNAGESYLHG